MNNNSLKANDYSRDEISLLALYQIFLKRKLIVLSVFSVTLMAAIVYLIAVQPVYEARVRLLSPAETTTTLGPPEYIFSYFEPEKIFQEIGGQLQLSKEWRSFVLSNPELFSLDDEKKQNQILVSPLIAGSKKKNISLKYIDVSYRSHNPELAAKILRNYIKHVHKDLVSELMELVEYKLDLEKTGISLRISKLRQHAKLTRDDSIKRLKGDLETAKLLGITENSLLSQYGGLRKEVINIVNSNNSTRNYMLGTKVLEAELDALLGRESDDPYITELPNMQVELMQLGTVKMNPERFLAYRQDGEIYSPETPINPDKMLVIKTAIVIGFLLGLLMAFFVENISGAVWNNRAKN